MIALPPAFLPFFCAAAGLALWHLLAFAAAPASALKSAVKTGAVAWLALGLWGAGPAGGPGWAVLAGLWLGTAGDFFLSRRGERAFLLGMAAFGAGHLAYAGAFWVKGTGWPDPVAGLAVLGIGGAALLVLAPRAGALAGPVRAYVAVIVVMVLAALRLQTDPWPVAGAVAGALLFMVSDLLLALLLFVWPARPGQWGARALGARGVWVLYWPAQALIAASAL